MIALLVVVSAHPVGMATSVSSVSNSSVICTTVESWIVFVNFS